MAQENRCLARNCRDRETSSNASLAAGTPHYHMTPAAEPSTTAPSSLVLVSQRYFFRGPELADTIGAVDVTLLRETLEQRQLQLQLVITTVCHQGVLGAPSTAFGDRPCELSELLGGLDLGDTAQVPSNTTPLVLHWGFGYSHPTAWEKPRESVLRKLVPLWYHRLSPDGAAIRSSFRPVPPRKTPASRRSVVQNLGNETVDETSHPSIGKNLSQLVLAQNALSSIDCSELYFQRLALGDEKFRSHDCRGLPLLRQNLTDLRGGANDGTLQISGQIRQGVEPLTMRVRVPLGSHDDCPTAFNFKLHAPNQNLWIGPATDKQPLLTVIAQDVREQTQSATFNSDFEYDDGNFHFSVVRALDLLTLLKFRERVGEMRVPPCMYRQFDLRPQFDAAVDVGVWPAADAGDGSGTESAAQPPRYVFVEIVTNICCGEQPVLHWGILQPLPPCRTSGGYCAHRYVPSTPLEWEVPNLFSWPPDTREVVRGRGRQGAVETLLEPGSIYGPEFTRLWRTRIAFPTSQIPHGLAFVLTTKAKTFWIKHQGEDFAVVFGSELRLGLVKQRVAVPSLTTTLIRGRGRGRGGTNRGGTAAGKDSNQTTENPSAGSSTDTPADGAGPVAVFGPASRIRLRGNVFAAGAAVALKMARSGQLAELSAAARRRQSDDRSGRLAAPPPPEARPWVSFAGKKVLLSPASFRRTFEPSIGPIELLQYGCFHNEKGRATLTVACRSVVRPVLHWGFAKYNGDFDNTANAVEWLLPPRDCWPIDTVLSDVGAVDTPLRRVGGQHSPPLWSFELSLATYVAHRGELPRSNSLTASACITKRDHSTVLSIDTPLSGASALSSDSSTDSADETTDAYCCGVLQRKSASARRLKHSEALAQIWGNLPAAVCRRHRGSDNNLANGICFVVTTCNQDFWLHDGCHRDFYLPLKRSDFGLDRETFSSVERNMVEMILTAETSYCSWSLKSRYTLLRFMLESSDYDKSGTAFWAWIFVWFSHFSPSLNSTHFRHGVPSGSSNDCGFAVASGNVDATCTPPQADSDSTCRSPSEVNIGDTKSNFSLPCRNPSPTKSCTVNNAAPFHHGSAETQINQYTAEKRGISSIGAEGSIAMTTVPFGIPSALSAGPAGFNRSEKQPKNSVSPNADHNDLLTSDRPVVANKHPRRRGSREIPQNQKDEAFLQSLSFTGHLLYAHSLPKRPLPSRAPLPADRAGDFQPWAVAEQTDHLTLLLTSYWRNSPTHRLVIRKILGKLILPYAAAEVLSRLEAVFRKNVVRSVIFENIVRWNLVSQPFFMNWLEKLRRSMAAEDLIILRAVMAFFRTEKEAAYVACLKAYDFNLSIYAEQHDMRGEPILPFLPRTVKQPKQTFLAEVSMDRFIALPVSVTERRIRSNSPVARAPRKNTAPLSTETGPAVISSPTSAFFGSYAEVSCAQKGVVVQQSSLEESSRLDTGFSDQNSALFFEETEKKLPNKYTSLDPNGNAFFSQRQNEGSGTPLQELEQEKLNTLYTEISSGSHMSLMTWRAAAAEAAKYNISFSSESLDRSALVTESEGPPIQTITAVPTTSPVNIDTEKPAAQEEPAEATPLRPRLKEDILMSSNIGQGAVALTTPENNGACFDIASRSAGVEYSPIASAPESGSASFKFGTAVSQLSQGTNNLVNPDILQRDGAFPKQAFPARHLFNEAEAVEAHIDRNFCGLATVEDTGVDQLPGSDLRCDDDNHWRKSTPDHPPPVEDENSVLKGRSPLKVPQGPRSFTTNMPGRVRSPEFGTLPKEKSGRMVQFHPRTRKTALLRDLVGCEEYLECIFQKPSLRVVTYAARRSLQPDVRSVMNAVLSSEIFYSDMVLFYISHARSLLFPTIQHCSDNLRLRDCMYLDIALETLQHELAAAYMAIVFPRSLPSGCDRFYPLLRYSSDFCETFSDDEAGAGTEIDEDASASGGGLLRKPTIPSANYLGSSSQMPHQRMFKNTSDVGLNKTTGPSIKDPVTQLPVSVSKVKMQRSFSEQVPVQVQQHVLQSATSGNKAGRDPGAIRSPVAPLTETSLSEHKDGSKHYLTHDEVGFFDSPLPQPSRPGLPKGMRVNPLFLAKDLLACLMVSALHSHVKYRQIDELHADICALLASSSYHGFPVQESMARLRESTRIHASVEQTQFARGFYHTQSGSQRRNSRITRPPLMPSPKISSCAFSLPPLLPRKRRCTDGPPFFQLRTPATGPVKSNNNVETQGSQLPRTPFSKQVGECRNSDDGASQICNQLQEGTLQNRSLTSFRSRAVSSDSNVTSDNSRLTHQSNQVSSASSSRSPTVVRCVRANPTAVAAGAPIEGTGRSEGQLRRHGNSKSMGTSFTSLAKRVGSLGLVRYQFRRSKSRSKMPRCLFVLRGIVARLEVLLDNSFTQLHDSFGQRLEEFENALRRTNGDSQGHSPPSQLDMTTLQALYLDTPFPVFFHLTELLKTQLASVLRTSVPPFQVLGFYASRRIGVLRYVEYLGQAELSALSAADLDSTILVVNRLRGDERLPPQCCAIIFLTDKEIDGGVRALCPLSPVALQARRRRILLAWCADRHYAAALILSKDTWHGVLAEVTTAPHGAGLVIRLNPSSSLLPAPVNLRCSENFRADLLSYWNQVQLFRMDAGRTNIRKRMNRWDWNAPKGSIKSLELLGLVASSPVLNDHWGLFPPLFGFLVSDNPFNDDSAELRGFAGGGHDEQWLVDVDDFTPSRMGAESLALRVFAGTSIDFSEIVAPSIAVPFRAFDRVLLAPENRNAANKLSRLAIELESMGPNRFVNHLRPQTYEILSVCRQLIMTMSPPVEFLFEFQESQRVAAICRDSKKATVLRRLGEYGVIELWTSLLSVWCTLFTMPLQRAAVGAGVPPAGLRVSILIQDFRSVEYSFSLFCGLPLSDLKREQAMRDRFKGMFSKPSPNVRYGYDELAHPPSSPISHKSDWENCSAASDMSPPPISYYGYQNPAADLPPSARHNDAYDCRDFRLDREHCEFCGVVVPQNDKIHSRRETRNEAQKGYGCSHRSLHNFQKKGAAAVIEMHSCHCRLQHGSPIMGNAHVHARSMLSDSDSDHDQRLLAGSSGKDTDDAECFCGCDWCSFHDESDCRHCALQKHGSKRRTLTAVRELWQSQFRLPLETLISYRCSNVDSTTEPKSARTASTKTFFYGEVRPGLRLRQTEILASGRPLVISDTPFAFLACHDCTSCTAACTARHDCEHRSVCPADVRTPGTCTCATIGGCPKEMVSEFYNGGNDFPRESKRGQVTSGCIPGSIANRRQHDTCSLSGQLPQTPSVMKYRLPMPRTKDTLRKRGVLSVATTAGTRSVTTAALPATRGAALLSLPSKSAVTKFKRPGFICRPDLSVPGLNQRLDPGSLMAATSPLRRKVSGAGGHPFANDPLWRERFQERLLSVGAAVFAGMRASSVLIEGVVGPTGKVAISSCIPIVDSPYDPKPAESEDEDGDDIGEDTAGMSLPTGTSGVAQKCFSSASSELSRN